jgi:hypothetical protein
MYENGQRLTTDDQFQSHVEYGVPIQIYSYSRHEHRDVGFVQGYNANFVQVNDIYYNRHVFVFLSRPGY